VSLRLTTGKDVACQTDTPNTSSENCFAELWNELNLTTIDLDIYLPEILQDLTN